MNASVNTACVDVVYCLDGMLPDTSCTLERLIEHCASRNSASCVVVRGTKAALFLLCAAPTTEESEWSLKEAISQVAEVVHSHSKSEGVAFLFSGASGITFAMTASKFHAGSSVLLSPTEKEYCSLEKPGSIDTSATWRSYFPIPMRSSFNTSIDEESGTMILQPVGIRLIRYLSLALFVIILLSLSALFLPGQRHPWRRFDEVVGSNGPQYQLPLKPQNVSQWASTEDDVLDSKWFLRIDDGSMYPKELLTPEETEYQAWLSERYPEVDAVKARRLFLDADYLSRPDENDMLIDKYFHISHCVHSMRRYWVAKETGHHICPMDLSHWHMNHCFENILLPWALPSGPRGTVPTGFEDVTPYNISWVTRVCF